jgi:hypothetical protein
LKREIEIMRDKRKERDVEKSGGDDPTSRRDIESFVIVFSLKKISSKTK